MASEWIELLLRANVALAAGIALVMAPRPIVRTRFGAPHRVCALASAACSNRDVLRTGAGRTCCA